MKVVRIRGRNRVDVKKRVLDYYFSNRDQLDESMKDFCKRCIIDPSGKTVIYRGQWWTHPTRATNTPEEGTEPKSHPFLLFFSFLQSQPQAAIHSKIQP